MYIQCCGRSRVYSKKIVQLLWSITVWVELCVRACTKSGLCKLRGQLLVWYAHQLIAWQFQVHMMKSVKYVNPPKHCQWCHGCELSTLDGNNHPCHFAAMNCDCV